MRAVAAHRRQVMHLVERLPPGSHDRAAFGGLQDSAPRAALFALHARMQQVHPDAWEDPLLVQIWFRMADYVVPRRDVGVFTIGALPRDPERRAALHDLADRVLGVLDGEPRSSREVAAAIPELDVQGMTPLRQLSVTGKVNIRWDTRTTTVVPAAPSEIDEEDARRELARRFLHWLGPANASQLARWAGIDRSDAEATCGALGRELVPIATARLTGMIMLASDEERMSTLQSQPSEPDCCLSGDPYLVSARRSPRRRPTSRPRATRSRPRRQRSPREQPGRPSAARRVDRRLVGSRRRRVHCDSVAAAVTPRARRDRTRARDNIGTARHHASRPLARRGRLTVEHPQHLHPGLRVGTPPRHGTGVDVTEACLRGDAGACDIGDVAMQLETFELRVLLVRPGDQQPDCGRCRTPARRDPAAIQYPISPVMPLGVRVTCPARRPSASNTAKAYMRPPFHAFRARSMNSSGSWSSPVADGKNADKCSADRVATSDSAPESEGLPTTKGDAVSA